MRNWILPALADRSDCAVPTEEGSVTDSIGSRDSSAAIISDIERVTR